MSSLHINDHVNSEFKKLTHLHPKSISTKFIQLLGDTDINQLHMSATKTKQKLSKGKNSQHPLS